MSVMVTSIDEDIANFDREENPTNCDVDRVSTPYGSFGYILNSLLINKYLFYFQTTCSSCWCQ